MGDHSPAPLILAGAQGNVSLLDKIPDGMVLAPSYVDTMKYISTLRRKANEILIDDTRSRAQRPGASRTDRLTPLYQSLTTTLLSLPPHLAHLHTTAPAPFLPRLAHTSVQALLSSTTHVLRLLAKEHIAVLCLSPAEQRTNEDVSALGVQIKDQIIRDLGEHLVPHYHPAEGQPGDKEFSKVVREGLLRVAAQMVAGELRERGIAPRDANKGKRKREITDTAGMNMHPEGGQDAGYMVANQG